MTPVLVRALADAGVPALAETPVFDRLWETCPHAQLAEEEVQHEQWLRQHYVALIETGEPDRAIAVLEELQSTHPESEEALIAGHKLSTLTGDGGSR